MASVCSTVAAASRQVGLKRVADRIDVGCFAAVVDFNLHRRVADARVAPTEDRGGHLAAVGDEEECRGAEDRTKAKLEAKQTAVGGAGIVERDDFGLLGEVYSELPNVKIRK